MRSCHILPLSNARSVFGVLLHSIWVVWYWLLDLNPCHWCLTSIWYLHSIKYHKTTEMPLRFILTAAKPYLYSSHSPWQYVDSSFIYTSALVRIGDKFCLQKKNSRFSAVPALHYSRKLFTSTKRSGKDLLVSSIFLHRKIKYFYHPRRGLLC